MGPQQFSSQSSWCQLPLPLGALSKSCQISVIKRHILTITTVAEVDWHRNNSVPSTAVKTCHSRSDVDRLHLFSHIPLAWFQLAIVVPLCGLKIPFFFPPFFFFFEKLSRYCRHMIFTGFFSFFLTVLEPCNLISWGC